jgi:hypothetical protein
MERSTVIRRSVGFRMSCIGSVFDFSIRVINVAMMIEPGNAVYDKRPIVPTETSIQRCAQ